MIKLFNFVLSAESLAAPVRFDTRLCTVVPAWHKLNQLLIDQSILQEQPLDDIASSPGPALICHAYNANSTYLKLVAKTINICRPSAIVLTIDCAEKKKPS